MKIDNALGAWKPSKRVARGSFWTLVFLAWGYFWRFPTVSNDDLYFMARAGLPGGRTTAASLIRSIRIDVMERNGRTADVLGQLIFSLGNSGTRWSMAALCCLLSLAIWLWMSLALKGTRAHRLVDAWGPLTCAALPFALTVLDPGLGGRTLLFMSATVGYTGGLAMFLLAMYPLTRSWMGSETQAWWLVASVPAVFATAFHHEVLGTTFVAIAAGAALIRQRLNWTPVSIGLTLFAGVIGLLRLAAPGLYSRRQRLTNPGVEESTLETALRCLVQFSMDSRPSLVLFVLSIAALAWATAKADPLNRALTLALLGALGSWSWAGTRLSDRIRRGVPVDVSHSTTVIVGAACAVMCLTIASYIVVRAALRRSDAVYPILVLTIGGVAGGLAIPLAAGSTSGRNTFFGVSFMIVTSLFVALWLVAEYGLEETPVVSATFAVTCIGMLIWLSWSAADNSLTAVKKNHQAWVPVEKQLIAARDGGVKVVTVPRNLPQPQYAPDWPRGKASALGYLRTIYDVPATVEIKWSPQR